MNQLSRYIATLMIGVICLSLSAQIAIAADLTELSEGDIAGISDRADLLDDEGTDLPVPTQKSEILQYTHAEKEIPEMTLLAEKSEYEQKSGTLTPGFITDPFREITSGTSSDLIANILLIDTGSFLDSFATESIFSTEIGKRIEIKTEKKSQKKVASTRGMITADITPGTLITSASGGVIDASQIGISLLDTSKKQKAKNEFEKKIKNRFVLQKARTEARVEGFEFGLSGSHLIFSKPVALTIQTPNMSDGIIVDLLTLHEGNSTFNTSGLSVNTSTTCNPDGTASLPGSQAIVKNGKITFYTCGASSFTMNPSGGTTTSNDVRLIIGDCGQIQVYYKGKPNIYTGAPPATGCAARPTWPTLRVGTTTIGPLGTAWNSMTTTGSQVGNTYTATTNLSATVGGLIYGMTINWSYTAPNSFFRMDYTINIPTGNTQNVKFYYGMDTFVANGDANDVGYYTGGTNPIAGIYDNVANQFLAMKYISGRTWAGYESGPYGNISTRITSGANFNNTTGTVGDLGFGVNWDFGTGTTGTFSSNTEWRMLPYVAGTVADLVPSIGQPTPSFTVNQTSLLPIVITNVGNASSTGTTTNTFTVPANFTGPTSAFSDNGWSCGATVGTTVTCTKSGSITPSGTDSFSIPLKPLPAAGGTNANFTTSITNTSDSNTANNSSTISLAVNVAAQTQTLWLKADAGTSCNTAGCQVSTWSDQSGLARNATQATATAQPLYVSGAVNGNPAVNFNTTAKVMNGITGTQRTIFAVRNLDTSAGYHTLFASAANTDFSIRSNGTAATNYTGGPNAQDWSNASGTPTNFWVDGKQTLTGKNQYHIVRTSRSAATAGTYSISSTFSTRGMTGNDAVAEVIAYNNLPTASVINTTESYLAIKYGITLDQTTARDYIFSDSATMWSASTAGIYKNDIAGIARDTASTLYQKKSQSINNTTDIIIETGAITNDKRSLVWANNGSATGTTTTTPGGLSRISRAWKIEENNGDIGTVKISYPNSVISGVFAAPLLIISTDGTFSSGTTTTVAGTLVGGNWEYLANITDGSVISFGQLGDITPPVISSSNAASGTLIPSGNFGLVISYSDTGSNIDTASFSGKIYAWDATGSIWGVTNIAPTYMSVSGTPTTSTGNLQIANLPFGKYRFDISVADVAGNIQMQSYTYFVDKIEWTVSSPIFNIGDIQSSILGFGTGELIVTVKTVGAGFSISHIRNTDLTSGSDTITVYNGTNGWGYDQWNGSAYPGVLLAHGTTQTLATVAKNINTNGQQNTFTYRMKYGVGANANTPAGDYTGSVRFDINLNY